MEIPITIGKEEQLLRGSGFTFELCKFNKAINKKTGEPVGWSGYRFYSSLEQGFKDILKGKIASSEANTLTELKQEMVRITDELRGYYDENVIDKKGVK